MAKYRNEGYTRTSRFSCRFWICFDGTERGDFANAWMLAALNFSRAYRLLEIARRLRF